MTRPTLRGIAVLIGAGTLALGGCRERGRPDPNVRMAISHEPAAAAAAAAEAGAPNAERAPDGGGAVAQGQGNPEIPSRLEVPPEVEQAYGAVRIGWSDRSNGRTGVIEVPLGGATPLPDPSLVVRADVFLPAFTMGGGAITSAGVEPQNPAARIAIFEKGKEIFAGWIFAKFPDVHPFTHPRFQLRLEGGVARAAK
jgi:Uncharacterized protein conserved in bacteria (DUF2155)